MRARAGHRHLPQLRQDTADLLVARLPGLPVGEALRLLEQARAWHSHAIVDLHDHLLMRSDALTSGSSDCPSSLIRLIHLLQVEGRTELVAPRCITCGTVAQDLPGVRNGGRVCLPCYRRQKKEPCAWCGRITKAAYRRPDGLICSSCRDTEPSTRGACPVCGFTKALRRGPDGTMRCDRCRPRPVSVCAGCGRLAPTDAVTDRGRLCRRCYQRPTRRCGGCGEVRKVSVRATATSPDLCTSCRPRLVGVCAGCSRHTFTNRQRVDGRLFCQTCRPKVHHPCSRCAQDRPPHAYWPTGPVCRSCYAAAKARPQPCARCTQTRVLIGHDPGLGAICGPCSGAEVDYICRRCGRGEHPPATGGLCAGCVRADTVTAVFGSDRHGPLAPITAVLLAQPDPVVVLRWLGQTRTAQLLTGLAAGGTPVTHAAIDAFDPGLDTHLLRHMLVAAGVLPDRDEHLERIGPWFEALLADRPAAHARLLRPFVGWTMLHRARRNAAARGFSPQAALKLRGKITAILNLLDWLDNRQLTLATAGQADIDTWVSTVPVTRPGNARPFLTWARVHQYASDVAIPAAPPHQLRLRPLTDDAVREQLRRCLHDPTIPIDARFAGALILLFGTTTARLVRLHTHHIRAASDGQVHVHLGRTPLTLPQPLALLATTFAAGPPKPRSPLAQAARIPLLFPGRAPDQALSARALRNKLHRHGIIPVPGRHAALAAITHDLPTPVLADLLGVSYPTASRWAIAVNTDWTHYLAAREETSP